MIRFLLDTDTISLLQRQDEAVQAFLESLPTVAVGVSVISYQEQVQGRLAWLMKAKSPLERERAYQLLADTPLFFAEFRIVGFTEVMERRFEELRNLKLNVGPNDLRIATTALEIGAVVVTRNLRDFSRVPGLQIETWAEWEGSE
jgi:tRNA(fMet)-specific endonuclease VapC